MAKRLTKDYIKYREGFYREKKRNNIQRGYRVLSLNQFKNTQKYTGMTGNQILKEQKLMKTKAQEKEVWRDYLRARKYFSRGETFEVKGGYEGLTMSSKGGISEEQADIMDQESLLKYHYNLSGLLADGKALHSLITFQIDLGRDRKEVLADYGY